MTKGEQARLVAWRLRILQETAGVANVARVCRRFGLSHKSFYKWKQRHAKPGNAGRSDRPHAPRRLPRANVVSKISYLRSHYLFGTAASRRIWRAFIAFESRVHRCIAF